MLHKVYFFTDIHGQEQLYDNIVNWCKQNDKHCTIIYGGDACDRGESGYMIMKKLLQDHNIAYLKGNHEDTFVRAARALKNSEVCHYAYKDRKSISKALLDYANHVSFYYEDGSSVRLSITNGGESTLCDWIADGMPMDIVEAIDALPYTYSYGSLDFCHAGGTYEGFFRIKYDQGDMWDINEILWERSYFGVSWRPGRVCVYGHTPTTYIDPNLHTLGPLTIDKIRPVRLLSDRIIMDVGSAFTDKCYVLDCDTMLAHEFLTKDHIIHIDEHIFDLNKEENS